MGESAVGKVVERVAIDVVGKGVCRGCVDAVAHAGPSDPVGVYCAHRGFKEKAFEPKRTARSIVWLHIVHGVIMRPNTVVMRGSRTARL